MTEKSKIYTRTGDSGKTALYGGKRVDKSDLKICAKGAIDEVNSSIGVVISYIFDLSLSGFLQEIQKDLFTIGALLSGQKPKKDLTKKTQALEQKIDELDKYLPQLHNFILPGGVQAAAFVHLARSIVRRAERDVVALSQKKEVDSEIIKYLNRLSDFLFVLARILNQQSGINDVIWKGNGKNV